jgi:glutaconate CoA-transferase subunit A
MMTKPNKLISLREALELVPRIDGALALGGMTMYRRPMAYALGLSNFFANHGYPSDLTLLSFTGGLESDILIAAGMVKRVRSCYFGFEAFGLAPYFTQAASQGSIQIVEETEASIALGLRATLAGVGFMPSFAWQGTDLLKLRPDVQTVRDPYSDEELTAFPAIHCDVAVLHAHEADPEGNANIGGNWGVDRELALAAQTVIITAEKVVPRLERADIVAPIVDAVVEKPNGAWPTSCHPLYPLDGHAILRYLEAAGTESFTSLLQNWSLQHGVISS